MLFCGSLRFKLFLSFIQTITISLHKLSFTQVFILAFHYLSISNNKSYGFHQPTICRNEENRIKWKFGFPIIQTEAEKLGYDEDLWEDL